MKDELLLRYISKRCSAEEENRVEEWLKEKDNRERLFELEQVWGIKEEIRFSDNTRMDKAYQQLASRLNLKGNPIRTEQRKWRIILTKVWFKYAAVLIIGCLLAVNIFYVTKEDPVAYNTVVVPKAQRVSLILSDGTTVWLNAESRFSYPTKFSESNRTVELEGEGYFEVAHNPKSPFTVALQNLNIRVLGTKFNAKAYPNEPNLITLKEGSIEVSTLDYKYHEMMSPNDQVYYTLSDGLVLIKQTEASNVDTWTTGDLWFDNQTIAEMAKEIERRYDVKIKIMDSSLINEYFTCHFRKDLTIEQAMDLLKDTRRLNYKIENQTVYLYNYR